MKLKQAKELKNRVIRRIVSGDHGDIDAVRGGGDGHGDVVNSNHNGDDGHDYNHDPRATNERHWGKRSSDLTVPTDNKCIRSDSSLGSDEDIASSIASPEPTAHRPIARPPITHSDDEMEENSLSSSEPSIKVDELTSRFSELDALGKSNHDSAGTAVTMPSSPPAPMGMMLPPRSKRFSVDCGEDLRSLKQRVASHRSSQTNVIPRPSSPHQSGSEKHKKGGWDRRGTNDSGISLRRTSIMDYPEVGMIIHDLNERMATLDALAEQINAASAAFTATGILTDGEGGRGGDAVAAIANVEDGVVAPATAIQICITPDQKTALLGLSSNVRGLVHCLQHRHNEQQSKILLTLADSDEEDDGDSLNQSHTKLDMIDAQLASYGEVRRVAKSETKKKLLSELIGLEEPKRVLRRQTVSTADPKFSGGSRLVGESKSIPREILLGMMSNAEGRAHSSFGPSAAAYLAHEYGGLELPRRYTVEGVRRSRTMKGFAKALTGANTFCSQMRLQGNVGKSELEYLPKEFLRLDFEQRTRLAEMLSWKGLKAWGLNAFEIEEQSAIKIFKSRSKRNLMEGDFGNVGATPFRSMQHSDPCEDDVLESSDAGCPLVLMGWALLASPYSQLAMARNVNDKKLIKEAFSAMRQRSHTIKGNMAKKMLEGRDSITENDYEDEIIDEIDCSVRSSEGGSTSSFEGDKFNGKDGENIWTGGYFIPDEFDVSPRVVCRFLRKVESEYSERSSNPYHNNIHAADVMQATHALLQMGGQDLARAYTPLEIYSILLAAACHDIRHPGTNNNYQVNKMTELSLRYNDESVLENMHASRMSYLLEGLNDMDHSGEGGIRRQVSDGSSSVATAQDTGDNYSGILGAMTKEQRKQFRTSVIRSILSTDMKRHFGEVAKITRHVDALKNDIDDGASLLNHINKENHGKLREKFLPFVLHMADISNPAKPKEIGVKWANAVYDEFFIQGDTELEEGLPMSPLCDRNTTNRAEAQVGFMNFVVKPAFLLLARCIPAVEDVVMPHFDDNFAYWESEKEKEVRGVNEKEERGKFKKNDMRG